jgi:hypothetical protein
LWLLSSLSPQSLLLLLLPPLLLPLSPWQATAQVTVMVAACSTSDCVAGFIRHPPAGWEAESAEDTAGGPAAGSLSLQWLSPWLLLLLPSHSVALAWQDSAQAVASAWCALSNPWCSCTGRGDCTATTSAQASAAVRGRLPQISPSPWALPPVLSLLMSRLPALAWPDTRRPEAPMSCPSSPCSATPNPSQLPSGT